MPCSCVLSDFSHKDSGNDSANNLIWNEHLTKLKALAVSDRVHKRKIESITIQEEIGRAEEQMSKRHQREHTPEDKITPDCTISEEYIAVENRSYSMDYFTGPGVPEWHLNEDSTRWIVSDIDISEICREYRTVVVKKSESMEVTLSATEELVLSHVFVFQEQSALGLCGYFDDELWAELFTEFRGLYPYAPIPDKISNLFLNIVKISCEEQNQSKRQKLARRYLRNFETTTVEEEIIEEIFRSLIDNEQSLFTQNNSIEDTHIIQNVTPIITRPFFKNSRKITFEECVTLCQ